MKTTTLSRLFVAMVLSSTAFVGCSESNSGGEVNPEVPVESKFFISATGGDTEAKDYLITVDDLSTGSTTIKGNGLELQRSGYTWIFPTTSTALGFIYQKGDPGVGLGITIDANGGVAPSGSEFLIESRFTTYGVVNGLAVTAVSGQAVPNDDTKVQSIFNVIDPSKGNAKTTKTFVTTNMTGNGEFHTLSGIVDAGDGTFFTSLVPSKTIYNGTGGSSTTESDYPDSVWVAKFDTDLNLLKVYGDDRLGYSSGRNRSQYYSQIANDEAGNTYVFSGAYNEQTTKKAGVIRIVKGTDNFDENFYYDIETAAGGHLFQKVWHITGDYFLLSFYNKPGSRDRNDGVTKYGIVNVANKSFKWVESGFPTTNEITASDNAFCFDGKAHVPLTVENKLPAVYVIDPATATAVRGIEVNANQIQGVGKLTREL